MFIPLASSFRQMRSQVGGARQAGAGFLRETRRCSAGSQAGSKVRLCPSRGGLRRRGSEEAQLQTRQSVWNSGTLRSYACSAVGRELLGLCDLLVLSVGDRPEAEQAEQAEQPVEVGSWRGGVTKVSFGGVCGDVTAARTGGQGKRPAGSSGQVHCNCRLCEAVKQ